MPCTGRYKYAVGWKIYSGRRKHANLKIMLPKHRQHRKHWRTWWYPTTKWKWKEELQNVKAAKSWLQCSVCSVCVLGGWVCEELKKWMRVMELDCVDFSLMLLLPACMHRTANTGICAISVRFNAMRLTQLLGWRISAAALLSLPPPPLLLLPLCRTAHNGEHETSAQ